MARSWLEGMPGIKSQHSQYFSVKRERGSMRKSETLHVPRMSNERRRSNLRHSGTVKPEGMGNPNGLKISKKEEYIKKGKEVWISCSSWEDGKPNLPGEILEEKDEGSLSLDKGPLPFSDSRKSGVEMSGIPGMHELLM